MFNNSGVTMRKCTFITLFKVKLTLIIFFSGVYFMGFSQNITDITVTVTFENPPTSYFVKKAPLKFNKKFALSMQIDDGNSSIFYNGYPVFEGGDISGTTYPGMKYSDGCGNLHSFKITSSVFPFSGIGTDLHNDPGSDFITWSQLDTLYQHNWGIANHGVNSDAFGIPEFINYSIERNKSYIYRKMINSTSGGVHPKVFVNPNGNSTWTTPAFNFGSICALNESGAGPFGDYGGDVNQPSVDWTQKYNLFRVNTGNVNVKDLIDSVAAFSTNGANYWCPIYTHNIYTDYAFADFLSDFNYIDNKYGSNGTDDILMTTDEELLDYLYVRDAITVSDNLAGNKLTISFSGNLPSDLLYYATSLVVSSNTIITDIAIQGTSNFSTSPVGDSSALVNINFDEYVAPDAEVLATDYTNIALATQTEYDALIAMDYVTTLDYGEVKNNLVSGLCGIPGVAYDQGFCESGYPTFVSISGDSIITSGQATTLTATSYLNNYEWSNGQVTQSITVSPQTDTKYWVSAITQGGIAVSDTLQVIVSDSYIIDHSPLSVDHVIGVPDSLWVTLKDGATSLWSTGSTLNYIIVDTNVSSIYHLDVLFNDTIVNQLDFDVYIGNIVDFSYNTVCLGDTTILVNTSVVNDSVTKVMWDLNGDTQFTDAEGDTVSYVFAESGDHLVGMRISYKTDPVDIVYNAVPVGDIPTVAFSYSSTCVGGNTYFDDKSIVHVGVINDWYWEFGDGNTDRFKNVSNNYGSPGFYNVNLTVTSSIGCSNFLMRTIEITSIPDVVLVNELDSIINNNDTVYFAEGTTVSLTVSNFASYDSVIWFNSDRAKTVVLAEEGNGSVTCYMNGCSTKHSFYTKWGNTPVPPPVGNKIMNLFTPNGDGINDVWLVSDPNIVRPVKVVVYNRNGREVYSNNNYQNTWDGQFEGNPLPQATYYYIIDDAQGVVTKGAVTIIR